MDGQVWDKSPLDEYLENERDVSPDPHDMEGPVKSVEDDSASGDTTLVKSSSSLMASKQGWTGPIPSTPSSSRVSGLGVYAPTPPGTYPLEKDADRGFEERFKYLVCSSGVLERDYVPGLSSGLGDGDGAEDVFGEEDIDVIEDDRVGGATTQVDLMAAENHNAANIESVLGVLKTRWDLILAGVALLGGLVVAVGVQRLLLYSSVFAIIMSGGIVYRYWRRTAHQSCLAFSDLSGIEPTSLLYPVIPALPQTTRQKALQTLSHLLQSSHSLDMTLDMALNFIQSRATPHEEDQTQSLRLAIHRFTGDVTDHLASATSRLLLLVDRSELKVLGTMYDIPLTSGQITRTGYSARVEDDQTGGSDMFKSFSASVPSPRRGIRPLNLQIDRSPYLRSPTRPYPAQPMSTSLSLPEHLYSTGQKRNTAHLSLVPPAVRGGDGDDDRFTSLPSRKPRLSKRSSWDAGLWSVAGEGMNMSAKRPGHERRITEADEGGDDESGREVLRDSVEADLLGRTAKVENAISLEGPFTPTPRPRSLLLKTPSRDTNPPNQLPSSYSHRTLLSPDIPLRPNPIPHMPITPISQNRKTHNNPPSPAQRILFPQTPMSNNPKRRSLQSMPYHPSFSPELNPVPRPRSITLHPSTPVSTNPKRRSLQNMPYYSDLEEGSVRMDDGEVSVELTRTRSMPFSELQASRSRTSTGSRTRRTSLVLGMGGISPLQARLMSGRSENPGMARRVPSISPLTLQGLKASCLGVHLKRRKLACCLLGLKFDVGEEQAERYWGDVIDVLGGLREGLVAERKRLLGVCGEVRAKVFGVGEDTKRQNGSWDRVGEDFEVSRDFAPRMGDRAVLLNKVEEMKKDLEDVWVELRDIYKILNEGEENGDEVEVGRKWSSLRERYGGLLRSWERGKESANNITRLHPPAEQFKTVDAQEEMPARLPPLPSFMKAWKDGDDDTSGTLSIESDRPVSPETQPVDVVELTDLLPPPGMDEVYEAVVAPSILEGRIKGLGRDERIRLMKDARGMGLTLGEMLRREAEGVDVARGRSEQEGVRVNGEEMLGELKELIGVIRRRKGETREEGEETIPKRDVANTRAEFLPSRDCDDSPTMIMEYGKTATKDIDDGNDLTKASTTETRDFGHRFVFPTPYIT